MTAKTWLKVNQDWSVEIDFDEAEKMAERARANPYPKNWLLAPEINDIMALVAIGVRDHVLRTLHPDAKVDKR